VVVNTDQPIAIEHQQLRMGPTRRDEAPTIVLLWCLWLLGSWLIIRYEAGMTPAQMLGLGEHSGPATSATDLRWMILAALTGLSGLWPAVRLSQGPARRRRREAATQPLVDWVGLILIWQVVLWPVYALLPWPLIQVVWLDVAVIGWALLMALLIGLGRASGGGTARMLAMVGCVALVVVEPAFQAGWNALVPTGLAWVGPLRLSPIEMLWALTAPPGYFTLEPWRSQALAVSVAAGLGWLLMLGWLGLGRRDAW
jgi:hypothetical protein